MDDETIGNGATTLDWLKVKYPWLKDMLAAKDENLTRVVEERAALHEILADKNGNHRGCGCDCAPLDVMARDLVMEWETAIAEAKTLREAARPGDVWCPICGGLMAKEGEKYQCGHCENRMARVKEYKQMYKALQAHSERAVEDRAKLREACRLTLANLDETCHDDLQDVAYLLRTTLADLDRPTPPAGG